MVVQISQQQLRSGVDRTTQVRQAEQARVQDVQQQKVQEEIQKQEQAKIEYEQKVKEFEAQAGMTVEEYNQKVEKYGKAYESYPGEFSGVTYRQYKHSLTHRPVSSGEFASVGDYNKFQEQAAALKELGIKQNQLATTDLTNLSPEQVAKLESVGLVSVTPTQQDSNINPATGREYGTLTPTPTAGQIYKRYIDTEGKIKGRIGYAADWLKGKYDIAEQK
jgi:hypothetical protein